MEKRNFDRIFGFAIALALPAYLFLIPVFARNPFYVASLAGTLVLLLFAWRNKDARLQLAFLGLAMPLGVCLVAIFNALIAYLQPRTIDAILSRLDGGLSVAIYHWTFQHPPVHAFLWCVYFALPTFAALVLGLSQQRMACFRSFVLAAIFAPFFYYLFPAVGPAHIGQPAAPPNCFPSLHLTWALQMVLYSRSRLRTTATAYLILVVAATLGMGEHYVADLVAAVPYTLALYWIESRLSVHLPVPKSQPEFAAAPLRAPLPVTRRQARVN